MSQTSANPNSSKRVTIVGAGIAGLTAAIACAEDGAAVTLLEAHSQLGGRARSTDGPYKANLGPHALYLGAFWQWMREREILPAHVSPRLTGARLRIDGALRRTPPLGGAARCAASAGTTGPGRCRLPHLGCEPYRRAHGGAAVRRVRGLHLPPRPRASSRPRSPGRGPCACCAAPSPVRYPVGGWSTLVDSLERRVRELGVDVQTETRVRELPTGSPVILATELDQARELLNDDSLGWKSGTTLCVDLGLRHRRGDPAIVSDMDEAGWIGRYSTTNPSIAPPARS